MSGRTLRSPGSELLEATMIIQSSVMDILAPDLSCAGPKDCLQSPHPDVCHSCTHQKVLVVLSGADSVYLGASICSTLQA